MTLKSFPLVLAAWAAVSAAGAAQANRLVGVATRVDAVMVDSAGRQQTVAVDQSGRCNSLDAYQRGVRNKIDASVSGTGTDTHITQYGRNTRTALKVRGNRKDLHVFAGPCPKGSAPRPIKSTGSDRLDVIIAQCN